MCSGARGITRAFCARVCARVHASVCVRVRVCVCVCVCVCVGGALTCLLTRVFGFVYLCACVHTSAGVCQSDIMEQLRPQKA